jgi:hypothetical protein
MLLCNGALKRILAVESSAVLVVLTDVRSLGCCGLLCMRRRDNLSGIHQYESRGKLEHCPCPASYIYSLTHFEAGRPNPLEPAC